MGFRFSIERIHDNKTKGFFAVQANLNPLATYWDRNRKSNPVDAFLFTKPNYNCLSSSVEFDDGETIMKDFELDKYGLSIIVDIKVYIPDKDQF
jgi:hypothetical protein